MASISRKKIVRRGQRSKTTPRRKYPVRKPRSASITSNPAQIASSTSSDEKHIISELDGTVILEQVHRKTDPTIDFSIPVYREVSPLSPIKGAGVRNNELDLLKKRHERLEAEEKMLIRQDRIWQNEQKRTARLLKTPQQTEDVPPVKIIVHRKLRTQ